MTERERESQRRRRYLVKERLEEVKERMEEQVASVYCSSQIDVLETEQEIR